jgi:ribosome-associated protein
VTSNDPAVPSPLFVPDDELEIRATRSGGPGGQHVNTSSTRIEVRWNLDQSPSITPEQRARLKARLGRRVDANGVIRVVASETRSQARNRESAVARLREIVARALIVAKPRKPTRIPPGQKARRLGEKRRRSATKQHRRRVTDDE